MAKATTSSRVVTYTLELSETEALEIYTLTGRCNDAGSWDRYAEDDEEYSVYHALDRALPEHVKAVAPTVSLAYTNNEGAVIRLDNPS